MGGANASGSSSSSKSYVNPTQQKYLKDLYTQAATQSKQPLQYYPGQTVAAQDPATLQAQQGMLDYAQQGNAGLNQAGGYNSAVLSGQYLDPSSNPYLKSTYDLAARSVTDNYRDAVLPAINSRFALAGQAGSGNYAGAFAQANNGLGRSLADLGTQIYGGAYDSERNRQEAARSFAPTLAADQVDRLQLAQGVGQQRQQYQQSLLDDLISRFDFAQNEPGLRLSRYAQLLGSPTVLSNSKSGSQSYGFNLGGALPGL